MIYAIERDETVNDMRSWPVVKGIFSNLSFQQTESKVNDNVVFNAEQLCDFRSDPWLENRQIDL